MEHKTKKDQEMHLENQINNVQIELVNLEIQLVGINGRMEIESKRLYTLKKKLKLCIQYNELKERK